MKMKKSLRLLLLVLAVCTVLLGACQMPETVSIALGEFRYKQEITPDLGDAVASEGHTFLVVYLTPAKDTEVTLDDAHNYFYGGTQANIDGSIYDLYCLAYEQVDAKTIRFGLVFEIPDNGYTSTDMPAVELILPPT